MTDSIDATATTHAHPTAEPVGMIRWTVDLPRLDRERVLRAWTRRELGRRAHVDAKTISDMFRCRRRPTLGTVQALCHSLDLTLADVLRFSS